MVTPPCATRSNNPTSNNDNLQNLGEMGSMFIAPSNGAFFTNSMRGDMLMRTQYATDNILIGTHSNAEAAMTITSNTIVFNTDNIRYKVKSVSYDDAVVAQQDAAEACVSLTTLHPTIIDGSNADDVVKVCGGGRGPTRHPKWRGWRYENTADDLRAIAWYFTVNPSCTDTGFALDRMDTFYVRLRVAHGRPLPFIALYTHSPSSEGTHWFGARRHYVTAATDWVRQLDDAAEYDVMLYIGRDPREVGFLSLSPQIVVPLVEDPAAAIGEAGCVHLIALATDPAASPGSLDFVVTETGHRFGGRVQRTTPYL